MLEKPLLASHRCRLRLNPQTYQIMYRSHMGGDRWISDTPFGISNKETRCYCHYQSSSHRISQKYSDALYRPWKDPGFLQAVAHSSGSSGERTTRTDMQRRDLWRQLNLHIAVVHVVHRLCCVSKRQKLATKAGSHVLKLLGRERHCHCITRLSFLPHCLTFERSPCQISWCLSC